ncbi:hypothetical protein D5B42_23285 [Salmonella enterica subsp. enterica serovar Oranienburg]|nr:hypothetical protein [Salmonella enterica subsp. enterica serovar Oranienburg]
MNGYVLIKDSTLIYQTITLRLPMFVHDLVNEKTRGLKKKSIEALCGFAIDSLVTKKIKAKKVGYLHISYEANETSEIIYTGKKKQKTISLSDDIKKQIDNVVEADCYTTKIVVLCYIAMIELAKTENKLLIH